MQEGWVCPKCGGVMSPSFPVCWYCSKGTGAVRVTSGTDENSAPCDHVWGPLQITTGGQFSTCEKCRLTRIICPPPPSTTTSGKVDA
jgi:hypothetical protein